MVQAEVAGRFEAPIYGMFSVEDQIKKMDWGKGGPPDIHYHGQPLDKSKPSLLWDGEWEVTYVTFRDMGAAFACRDSRDLFAGRRPIRLVSSAARDPYPGATDPHRNRRGPSALSFTVS